MFFLKVFGEVDVDGGRDWVGRSEAARAVVSASSWDRWTTLPQARTVSRAQLSL